MAGSYNKPANVDLLGSSGGDTYGDSVYSPAFAAPGQTVDLSGGLGPSPTQAPTSNGPSSFSSSSSNNHFGGFGGGGYSSGPGPRGPTSIEGGGGGSLSLSDLTPANIARQLATRPVTELVTEQGRQLLQVPRYMARAYTAAARRYLRPWSEFVRIRPGRIIEGLRQASRRGEIQVHLQRNVLANARAFCPNYVFMFLATLFMFVCTSPMLLVMLCGVGGGWNHVMRSEGFRNRPWTLQIGGVGVPLGSNMKMAILSVPTLLFLHFFMGPLLWSAALCSGGASLAHAALRDREDDPDENDHGLGGSPSLRLSGP